MYWTVLSVENSSFISQSDLNRENVESFKEIYIIVSVGSEEYCIVMTQPRLKYTSKNKSFARNVLIRV